MPPALSLTRGSTTLDLTSANSITVMPGIDGLDTPPVNLSQTEPAAFDGSLVMNVRYAPREIFIPITVTADTEVAQRAVTRSLASLLNPQLGPVTLTVTHQPSVSGNQLSANATDGVATAFDAGTSVTLSTETTTVRTGSSSLKAAGGAREALLKSSERVTVADAATYTASVYARASSTTSTSCHLRFIWYDASGTEIASTWSEPVTSSSSAWTEITLTAAAPTDAVTVGLGTYAGGLSSDHFFDDFTLTEVATTREVTGYASAPLGETIGAGEALTWRRLGVQLTCEDPFFTGAASSALLEAPVDTIVSTTVPIVHSGDAGSWPLWSFTMSTSAATGDGIIVALLPAGSTTLADAVGAFQAVFDASTLGLTVNTNPRSLSALRADGSSGWDRIGPVGSRPSPQFFDIPPGEWNLYVVESLSGISTGDPELTMSLASRWLTAW